MLMVRQSHSMGNYTPKVGDLALGVTTAKAVCAGRRHLVLEGGYGEAAGGYEGVGEKGYSST